MKHCLTLGLLFGLLNTQAALAGSFDSPSNAVAATPAKTQQNAGSGKIDAVDVQSHTIMIQEKPYLLADDVKIYLPEENLVNQQYLAPGQLIEFWGKPHGKQVMITKIEIKSGPNVTNLPLQ